MQDFLTVFLIFLIGAAVGGSIVWVVLRGRLIAEKGVADTFKALAADILRQNNESFLQLAETRLKASEQSAAATLDKKAGSIDEMLKPLRERLQEFQKKIDDSFGEQAKEQFSLRKEIERIVAVNERMTLQTEGLSKALKGDVKVQGNWGEVMLEKILVESGLRKGKDYILQGVDLELKHVEDGRALRPDIVIMLPDEKHIIVDSKVSLKHYTAYCESAEEAERQAFLKEHINSLRNHVDGLEERRYHDASKLGTPDFVLMFMPIEGAYALAVENDARLHNYAWDKKIVIVCPSTLFATLRTIASVWRLELQNRNAMEIARRGGALYDKVVNFIEDMQKLGNRLRAATGTYDEAINKLSGSRGILSQTESLKKLGIRPSKKIPVELIGSDDLDETAENADLDEMSDEDEAA